MPPSRFTGAAPGARRANAPGEGAWVYSAALTGYEHGATLSADHSREVRDGGDHLLAVADGHGTDAASAICIAALTGAFRASRRALDRSVSRTFVSAHRALRREASPPQRGVSAVAVAIGWDFRGWVARVGDCRAYRFRDGGLVALTTKTDSGSRLGLEADPDLELTAIDLCPGDVLLLCTGDLDQLPETEVAKALELPGPFAAAEELMRRRRRHGGGGRLTVRVAAVERLTGLLLVPPERSRRGRRLRRRLAVASLAALLGVAAYLLEPLLGSLLAGAALERVAWPLAEVAPPAAATAESRVEPSPVQEPTPGVLTPAPALTEPLLEASPDPALVESPVADPPVEIAAAPEILEVSPPGEAPPAPEASLLRPAPPVWAWTAPVSTGPAPVLETTAPVPAGPTKSLVAAAEPAVSKAPTARTSAAPPLATDPLAPAALADAGAGAPLAEAPVVESAALEPAATLRPESAGVEPAPGGESLPLGPGPLQPASVEVALVAPSAVEPSETESAPLESAVVVSPVVEPVETEPAPLEVALVAPPAVESPAVESVRAKPAPGEVAAVEAAPVESPLAESPLADSTPIEGALAAPPVVETPSAGSAPLESAPTDVAMVEAPGVQFRPDAQGTVAPFEAAPVAKTPAPPLEVARAPVETPRVLPGSAEDVLVQESLPPFREGDVIRYTDIAKLRDYLPAPFWRHRHHLFFEGMALVIGPFQRDYAPSARRQAATALFGGEARIGPGGALEGYTLGQPFPRVEPSDPQAGSKHAWNMDYRHDSPEQRASFFFTYWDRGEQLPLWYKGAGFSARLAHRTDRAAERGELFAGESRKSALGFRIDAPFDMRGLLGLTYRYLSSDRAPDQAQRDDQWIYLPSLRRVRRFSAAERNDSLAGSDMTPDDMTGFSGIVPHFEWEYVGETQVLAPVDSQQRGYPHAQANFGPSGLSLADDEWQLRDAIILEQRPREERHPYARKRLWVDKQTYAVLFAAAWDRGNELWKLLYGSHRWSESDLQPGDVDGLRAFMRVCDVLINSQTGSGIRIEIYDNEPTRMSRGRIRRQIDLGRLSREGR